MGIASECRIKSHDSRFSSISSSLEDETAERGKVGSGNSESGGTNHSGGFCCEVL
jgi:hypothetical protein